MGIWVKKKEKRAESMSEAIRRKAFMWKPAGCFLRTAKRVYVAGNNKWEKNGRRQGELSELDYVKYFGPYWEPHILLSVGYEAIGHFWAEQ